MTRRFISGRLTATAVLLAASVLGVAAAPAAAAPCQGVEVTSSTGSVCLDTTGESTTVTGDATVTNLLSTDVTVGIDLDGNGPLLETAVELSPFEIFTLQSGYELTLR